MTPARARTRSWLALTVATLCLGMGTSFAADGADDSGAAYYGTDSYYGTGQFRELIAAAGQGGQGPIQVAETTVIAPGESIMLEGQGYGHGRGMSQFGARGAAELGVPYQEILAYYYPSTTLSELPDATSAPMRVWLEADDDGSTEVSADGSIQVRDASGGGVDDIAAGTRVSVAPNQDGTMTVWGLSDGDWSELHSGPGPITLTATSGTVQVIFPDETRTEYRGAIQATETSTGFKTLNVVPMEDYLQSVVPKEMQVWFPAEALKAQAVAARTYSAGEQATFADREWDICDSVQCQVYGGVAKYDADGVLADDFEAGSTSAAVAATAGQILLDDAGQVVFAQFSSSNGGWTTVGKNGEPYLVARPDTWDCVDNYAYPWTATVSSAQLAEQWPEIGEPTALTVTERTGNGTWGGRILSLRLDGTTGSVDVPGEDFRIALGLRSSWFRVLGTTYDDAVPAAPVGVPWQHVGTSEYPAAPTDPWHPCFLPTTLRDLRVLWSSPATVVGAS